MILRSKIFSKGYICNRCSERVINSTVRGKTDSDNQVCPPHVLEKWYFIFTLYFKVLLNTCHLTYDYVINNYGTSDGTLVCPKGC